MVFNPEEYTPPYIWPSLSTDPTNFVGRGEVLTQLHNLLKTNRVVVVLGMNGIGKTELALQYFNDCKSKDKYKGGYHWFDLRDRNLADVLANHQGITEKIIKEEKIREKNEQKLNNLELIQFCWDQLLLSNNSNKDGRGKVLVVLDSVNKYQIKGDMLPKDPRFSLLVMAEKNDLNLVIYPEIIGKKPNLEKLELKDAVELLKKWAGRRQIEDEAADYLCNYLLDRSPLGIELAGHYLRKNQKITISQFNEKLSNEWIPGKALNERHRIDSVLELSWQKLDCQSKKLAKLLGLFAPRIIPFEFPMIIANYADLEIRVKERLGCKDIFDYRRKQVQITLKSLYAPQEERLRPKEVFQNLADLGLIKWDKKKNIAILDTIVRNFLKDKGKDAEDIEGLEEAFVKIILKKGLKLKDINEERFVLIAPHLDEVIDNYTAQLEDNDFELFINVGNYYDSRRMYLAGSQWYKKWLKKANDRSSGGQNCGDKIKLDNLAILYEKIDNYPKDRPRCKRACQICEDISKDYSLTLAYKTPGEKTLDVLLKIVEILEQKPKHLSCCHLYERIWKLSDEEYGDADLFTKEAEIKLKKCNSPEPEATIRAGS